MDYRIREYPRLGEKLYVGQLDSGLTCLFLPKPGFKRKFALLATPYGAINRAALVNGNEFTTPAGIAHFLEHKLFEDPEASIENRFAALGASANAFTTHTQTAYLFSTTENFYSCLDLLLAFVQQPAFTESGVEAERGIIAQEIKMYLDQPGWAVYLGAMTGMYGRHPVADDIAGRVEDLALIDYPLLKQCHSLFYNPRRMVLVAAGDIEADELFPWIAANQAQKSHPFLGEVEDVVPFAREQVGPGQEKAMAVSRPLMNLGLRDSLPANWAQAQRQEALASLFLEIFIGKHSSFYNRLYDEGLIDNSFGVDYTSAPWYSHFIFGGETDEPERLAQALLTELKRFQTNGISADQVAVNKRKLLGLFIMDLNSLEGTVMAYATDWLQGGDYLARFQALEALQREEVEGFCRGLDLSKSCLSVVRPTDN